MIIGKIKMAPGNVGWYDPISRIALTQANPIAEIKSEMNLDTVRRGLLFGTIILLEGTVDEEAIVAMQEKTTQQVQTKIEPAKQEVEVESVLEEKIAETVQEEQAIEQKAEEPKKSKKKK